MGRTARGSQGRGHALLFLLPEELGFLRYLKHAKVRDKFNISWKISFFGAVSFIFVKFIVAWVMVFTFGDV